MMHPFHFLLAITAIIAVPLQSKEPLSNEKSPNLDAFAIESFIKPIMQFSIIKVKPFSLSVSQHGRVLEVAAQAERSALNELEMSKIQLKRAQEIANRYYFFHAPITTSKKENDAFFAKMKPFWLEIENTRAEMEIKENNLKTAKENFEIFNQYKFN